MEKLLMFNASLLEKPVNSLAWLLYGSQIWNHHLQMCLQSALIAASTNINCCYSFSHDGFFYVPLVYSEMCVFCRCKSCNYQITSDDLEDWLYMQLADTTHLLQGVVHSNGYGHLLRINGREGGSKFLSGSHIMDFWDRLCKMLRVRWGLTYWH